MKTIIGHGNPWRRRLPGRKGGTRGLTLTELIITLALIATVGAVATPSFNRMAVNGNLRSSARDIQGRMAYLKERAMADSTRYTLTFDEANNCYWSSDMEADEWRYASSFGPSIQITSVSFGGVSTVASRPGALWPGRGISSWPTVGVPPRPSPATFQEGPMSDSK